MRACVTGGAPAAEHGLSRSPAEADVPAPGCGGARGPADTHPARHPSLYRRASSSRRNAGRGIPFCKLWRAYGRPPPFLLSCHCLGPGQPAWWSVGRCSATLPLLGQRCRQVRGGKGGGGRACSAVIWEQLGLFSPLPVKPAGHHLSGQWAGLWGLQAFTQWSVVSSVRPVNCG